MDTNAIIDDIMSINNLVVLRSPSIIGLRLPNVGKMAYLQWESRKIASIFIASRLMFSIHYDNTFVNDQGGGSSEGLNLILDLQKSFVSSLSKENRTFRHTYATFFSPVNHSLHMAWGLQMWTSKTHEIPHDFMIDLSTFFVIPAIFYHGLKTKFPFEFYRPLQQHELVVQ